MPVLLFDRDRLFRDLLLQVVVEVFEAVRHAVEPVRDLPHFVAAVDFDARGEVAAREPPIRPPGAPADGSPN